ncbi:MAG: hypothetical protein QG640_556 [Patescibacteria group bacterium]|nr:hypothetical protein [Patescibacteria group bacterium]
MQQVNYSLSFKLNYFQRSFCFVLLDSSVGITFRDREILWLISNQVGVPPYLLKEATFQMSFQLSRENYIFRFQLDHIDRSKVIDRLPAIRLDLVVAAFPKEDMLQCGRCVLEGCATGDSSDVFSLHFHSIK